MRYGPGIAVLLLASVALLASGCSDAASEQDPAALEGVEWQLVESSETTLDVELAGITASFDGSVLAGFSGVNRYNGPYTALEDGSFSAGPFAATLMAGPEALMEAEAAYLRLLEDVESFSIENDRLTLTAVGGETLTFAAGTPVDLSGSSWSVNAYNDGNEAVVGVVEGSGLTLEFGEDGTASGSGGVNTFSGPYEYSEDGSISIGPLVQTLMAGDDALMEQETRYFAALKASESWEVVNGVLYLRDADEAMQVNAVTP